MKMKSIYRVIRLLLAVLFLNDNVIVTRSFSTRPTTIVVNTLTRLSTSRSRTISSSSSPSSTSHEYCSRNTQRIEAYYSRHGFSSLHLATTSAINGDVGHLDNENDQRQRQQQDQEQDQQKLGGLKAALTKLGMITFIASMCLTLPIALLPPILLHRLHLISTTQRECLALRAGEFCARWLLRIIPFAKVTVIPSGEKETSNVEPTVWVCNHTSMLDVFFLMAMDKKLRGRRKRPIKVVYWKQLEDNPITGLLFKTCGFIPIDMAPNKPGESNEYDRSGFKTFLKSAKKAFSDGFDIGILPEGQLNPNPEGGLLPVFSGAYTLARMSRRPIRMLAMNGAHRLWHPDFDVGMKVTGRDVRLRAYKGGMRYENSEDFVEAFTKIVGYFGANGRDLPGEDLERYLSMGRVAEGEGVKKTT